MRYFYALLFIILYVNPIFATEKCNRTKPYDSNYIQPYELCDNDFSQKQYPKFLKFRTELFSEIQPLFPKSIPNASKDESEKWLTAIHETYEREGVNFSGHYLLVIRGCGAACSFGLIVDLRTGYIYQPKEFSQIIASVNPLTDSILEKLEIQDETYSYKPNSRLLILIGSLGEENLSKRGVYFFHWSENKLNLIKKVERIKK